MERILLRLGVFLFFIAEGQHISGELIPAALHEPVAIPANVTCATTATLTHRLKHSSPVTVANLINGIWVPEEKYRDRIKNSPSGLILTPVYNDNGLYEVTCGDDTWSRFELEVSIISNNNISVSEGEPAKLSCYFSTSDEPVKYIWWEINKKVVLKLNLSTGKIEYGPGFEGRVSLPSDLKLTGDVSLLLNQTRMEDGGDYHCFVFTTEKKRGNPDMVRLTVHHKTNSSSSPLVVSEEPKQDTCTGLWIAFGITFTLLIICLIIFIAFILWRYRRSGSSTQNNAEVGSPHVNGDLLLSPSHARSNGIL